MKFTILYYIGILAPTFSQACLLPEEREGKPRIVRRQTSNGIPIGTGDRYSAGTIAPRGVGSQTTTFTTLLNVNEIASGIKGLASVYGITTFNTPYKTYNGASITGAKVGGNGTCNDAISVYLNAAIHARERGASDGLLFFIGDLLYANKNGLGLKYGSKSYTNAQVKTALSTGIVFIPLSNPDGVAYDQSTNSCWRKNRNPKSGTGSSTGVDLNRNFDFLWDLTKWASSVRSQVASTSPSSEVFHGTAAFSEPETQSIKWVMDTYSKIRWFVDLHSYAGDILYSWGSDTNQASYPSMNFLNSAYNSVRGILSDTPGSGSGYGEYTPSSENGANKAAASKIGAGMSGAAGRTYSVFPAANLYPTSGASDDYSYSRHFVDNSKNLIHGYTIEFGFGNAAAGCPFYPTLAQHNFNLQEIGAGSGIMVQSPNNIGMPQNVDYNSPSTSNAPQNILSRTSSTALIPATLSSLPTSTAIVPASPPRQDATGIYSSTGFDMLGALMRVVSRPNKVINIGAVDLSCAFVVCDLREPDCPIIYVSDVFENLTGYSRHEVLGRNCRFLQSPEGKIQAGERRLDTENDKVYELKKAIDTRTETQQAIINYRKGGQPFMNLLTMIPIPASDDDPTLSLVVGFQVDVVANPNSVNEKTTAGNYTMNYKQGTLPRYQWHPPQPHTRLPDAGQTISRDDVSSVLASYDNGSDPELTKRMWEKVLLENSDDVIHVLSLKGLFMYLSPSCRQVLEYDSSELIGTALSSICHPSDIVPVTRELKETSQGSPVNVVFRVRRKNSGYTWFESHGSLCVEQGKGRKCIIMVGRERPVYALARSDLNRNEGLGENQLYSKLSTSGMFLYVASNVRSLLDRTPDDLVGTSIQALMRTDSKIAFGRALEKARTGKIVKYRHEIFNKRGVVLQAETTLYPGDASEGQKPTFLVAQTRLVKSTPRNAATTPGTNGSTLTGANTMVMSPVNKSDIQTPEGTPSNSLTRPQPSPFNEAMTPGPINTIAPVTQPGGCGLPIGSQDEALASEDNIFEELKTTRCTSWQYELRQMEKNNRTLGEELAMLINAKKKRKRRKLPGNVQRDCANCHTKSTPEWRRGPSGNRDLCNSCGLRYAKSQGRISSRTSKRSRDDASSKTSNSPIHSSPLQNELSQKTQSSNPNLNINPGNMKDEINDSRPRKVLKKSHSGDSAESVGSIGTASQGSAGGGGGGGKGSIGYGNIGVGGISNGGVMGSGTAVPASLGGRTTMESQPVHARSLGFNEGGVTGITNIEEGREGSGRSSTSSTNSMVKGALRNEENSVERGEREIMNEQIERYGDDLSF